MNHPKALREPMPMPDPHFPIKIHSPWKMAQGATLFPHHWHEHLEFLYCTSGKAIIECNSVPHSIEAGDLVVVNSNELHYGVSQSDDLLYYAMIVDLSLLHSHSLDAIEAKFITPITQNRIVFQNRISNDHDINICMAALIHELEIKSPGYELSIKSYLYRILTILYRQYVAPSEQINDYLMRMKNLERLTPVLSYITECYQEILTVDKLADIAGLSRYHFSRIFRDLTGKTITEYINIIRINKSEFLISNTTMNISEIALASGFNDIYYFSNVFKKIKKISPSQLRKGIT